MLENINRHHRLEAELHALRLLRDLGDPSFKAENENDLLDKMEEVWNQLTAEEREILERERKVVSSLRACPLDFPMVDVSIDKWRQGLPPRIPKPTGPDSDPTRHCVRRRPRVWRPNDGTAGLAWLAALRGSSPQQDETLGKGCVD